MKTYVRSKCSGFTLLEVLIATLIIGIAITSIVASNGAFTKANGAGLTISQAQFLLEQIRELSATLDVVDPETGTTTFGAEESSLANYDDLDDFDGLSFCPPIDIDRSQISDLSEYTQQITVNNVSLADLETVAADHSTDMVRVSVSVSLNGTEITSASWIRARIE